MANNQSSTQVEYRPIEGMEGYRIGSDGTVWSRWKPHGKSLGDWHELKTKELIKGVYRVAIRGKWFTISRLVLTAFIGKPDKGMQACHFPDRDPTNCHLDNLRWGTSQDNHDDQKLHGTVRGGENVGTAKLTNEQVDQIRALKGKFLQREIAAMFNTCQTNVSAILRLAAHTEDSRKGRGLRGIQEIQPRL